MNREDWKDVVERILDSIQSDPDVACFFGDCENCKDVKTFYGSQPVDPSK